MDFSIFLRFGFGNGDGEGDLGGGDGDLGDRGELGGVGSSSSFFLDRICACRPQIRNAEQRHDRHLSGAPTERRTPCQLRSESQS